MNHGCWVGAGDDLPLDDVQRAPTKPARLNAISLFSSAGGLDMGLERAGIHSVVHVEINPNAQSVLRRRWPDTPIHDDVETFRGDTYAAELVHGGSPCTDLSVAGRGAGLAGDSSRLYWHQIRVWRESGAPWLLWENVGGAFTSHRGADFAAVLWGITGALPEVPAGGWQSMGFITGPNACAAWRMLDARWFGVPQRRRRVFVVGSAAGDLKRCIEVLLDAESVRGDSAPGRTSGQDVAGTLGAGPPGRGWSDDTDRMTFVPIARHRGHGDYVADDQAQTLRTRSGDDSTTSDLIPMTFRHKAGAKAGAIEDPPCLAHTLGTQRGGAAVLLAHDHAEGHGPIGTEQFSPPLGASGDATIAIALGNGTPQLAVRRLTPIECERLMAWPDDHTRWGMTPAGKLVEIKDSHRYAMCGNGVVSTQAEWIGRRLAEVIS